MKIKVKDVHKLKRFGTYFIELDTDDKAKLGTFMKTLRKAFRFRFIKFILVPMGVVKLMEIKNKEKESKE